MRITKALAREIIEDTKGAGRGLLDGGISVCEYVSRHYEEELTIAQGARLHKLIQDEQTMKKPTGPESGA